MNVLTLLAAYCTMKLSEACESSMDSTKTDRKLEANVKHLNLYLSQREKEEIEVLLVHKV